MVTAAELKTKNYKRRNRTSTGTSTGIFVIRAENLESIADNFLRRLLVQHSSHGARGDQLALVGKLLADRRFTIIAAHRLHNLALV